MPQGRPVPDRGARVVVPFGPRRVIGVVTGAADGREERELKDVLDVVDEAPVVPVPLLDLATWMSDHYLAPPGECLRLVMPPDGVRASRAVARLLSPEAPSGDPVVEALRAGPQRVSTLARRLKSDPTSRLARLRRSGIVAVDQDLAARGFRHVQVAVLTEAPIAARGKAQVQVLDRLRAAGGRARVAELVRDRPSLRGAVERLAEAGALRVEEGRDARQPDVMAGAVAGRPEPTVDQAQALAVLGEAVSRGGYAPFVLHGVTGSGKTEVYFRTAEAALAAGRGVILLLPEIALTPVVVRAAVARFGPTVAVLHSELSAGERHDQWWRIREGESRMVVGARSAVFAPVTDVGLIVVDEEHEAAYKQEESPRYHGRDVAAVRAKLEAAPVVLGSATPSLETHANAVKGKYLRLVLPSRIGPRGLPRVEVVDRREVMKAGGDPILTPPLLESLAARLARREQSLLLL